MLRERRLTSFAAFLILSVLVIIVFELLWAPHPTLRYRMDFAWLLSLCAFILIGCAAESRDSSLRFSRTIGALCILALVVSVLMALYPQNKNFTEYYAMEIKAMLGMK